jgi:uncharacterized SAM-binding protein YcdF (DUF218 family)
VVALGWLGLGPRPARWLVLEDPPQSVDAALVLGGDYWFERTRTAAGLVRSGRAQLLVLAGRDFPPGSPMDLRAKALELGVPADRIRVDSTGLTTRESLVAVAPLLRAASVHSVALVTSPYHQRRAFLAARRALPGVHIVNRPATPSLYEPPERWWRASATRNFVVSEYAKLAYYAARGWL